MTRLPRVKAGDPITADAINALIDAANSAGLSIAPSSGLTLMGNVLAAQVPTFYWARTTGVLSGGTYPFTQQFPTSGGGWTDGPLTGTFYEVNGNTSLATGTLVKIWRAADGTWRASASAC